METENQAGLSDIIADLKETVAKLSARVGEMEERKIADEDARFLEINSAMRDFDRRFDDVENRLHMVEVGSVSRADAIVTPAGDSVDPAWIKSIFEKYFWNERPVPVAPSEPIANGN